MAIMKSTTKIFVLLAMLIVGGMVNANAKPGISEKDTLSVLTFNIWHGEKHYNEIGAGYESSLDILATVINKAKPDLVALQEVDNRTSRSKGVDLVSELGLLTQMNPLFGASMPFDGGEYGLGILSKYSFRSTNLHGLYTADGSEPRVALEVLVEQKQEKQSVL